MLRLPRRCLGLLLILLRLSIILLVLFSIMPVQARSIKNDIIGSVLGKYEGLSTRDVSVEFFGKLPENVVKYRINNKRLLGRYTIRVGSRSVLVQVRAFRDYWFAARFIERGKIIEEGDLKSVYNDIHRKPRNVVKDKEQILGKLAYVSIPEDALILSSMLRDVPVVKKGDMVLVTYRDDGFEFKYDGVVLEKGGMGDIVFVKGVELGKKLKGEVIDSKNITITAIGN